MLRDAVDSDAATGVAVCKEKGSGETMSYRTVESLAGCILDAWAEESVPTHAGIVSGQDFVERSRDEWMAKEQRRKPQDRREVEIVRCEMFNSERKCKAWRMGLRLRSDATPGQVRVKGDNGTVGQSDNQTGEGTAEGSKGSMVAEVAP